MDTKLNEIYIDAAIICGMSLYTDKFCNHRTFSSLCHCTNAMPNPTLQPRQQRTKNPLARIRELRLD